MEGNDRTLNDQEVENCIPDLLDDFRKDAATLGMHDQVIDRSEEAIREAYRRGLSDR